MIKSISFPDKEFSTKEELFKELKANEKGLIDLKKANIQKSAFKGQLSTFEMLKNDESLKQYLEPKENMVYAVINTTKYLDSHDDVHIDGIWNKSVTEQQGKVLYVTDHSLKIDSVIAWQNDIEMSVKELPFSFLGKGYEGNTQALIFAIDKSKIVNEKAREIIENKRPVQNSIRMEYVKIELAINDAHPDYAENKKAFDLYINQIANKEKALQQGYFWAVTEAKISKEGSMVLFGSNDVTPIIETKVEEPSEDTQNKEADKSLREKELLKELLNKF